jgi:hypothetical protein
METKTLKITVGLLLLPLLLAGALFVAQPTKVSASDNKVSLAWWGGWGWNRGWGGCNNWWW